MRPEQAGLYLANEQRRLGAALRDRALAPKLLAWPGLYESEYPIVQARMLAGPELGWPQIAGKLGLTKGQVTSRWQRAVLRYQKREPTPLNGLRRAP